MANIEPAAASLHTDEQFAKIYRDMASSLTKSEARVRELEQALEKLEWSSRDEGYPFCPLCLQGASHTKECLYSALHAKETNG